MTTALSTTGKNSVVPFHLEPACLRVTRQLSFEEWVDLGGRLRTMRDHVHWWLGDWWNYGEYNYGEMSSQEAQEELEHQVGYRYHTVRVAAWVASRYAPDARATDLSWRHHKEAAAIEDVAIRDALLRRARDEGWSLARLRREVRSYRRLRRLQPVASADITVIEGDLAVLSSLETKFALLIADPPLSATDQCLIEAARDRYLAFTSAWLTDALRHLGTAYHGFLFCPAEYGADLELHLRARDLPVQSRIVWHHPNVAYARTSLGLRQSWTPILHIGTRALEDAEGSDRVDVQTLPAPDGDANHRPKPVALVRWLVAIGSRAGDAVLDPFGGDAATVLACQGLGRRCTVIESDPALASAIRQRLLASSRSPGCRDQPVTHP